MNLPKWANVLFCVGQKYRLMMVEKILNGVRRFKKGVVTKEGEEFYRLLKSKDVSLIGYVADVTYMRAASRDKDDLEVLWNHPFSIPTLLYHLKGSPFLLLVNPNVEYNDSKLLEIDENADLIELRDLKGIIG